MIQWHKEFDYLSYNHKCQLSEYFFSNRKSYSHWQEAQRKEKGKCLKKLGFRKVGRFKLLSFFKSSSSSSIPLFLLLLLLQLLFCFNLAWSSWTLVVGVDYIIDVESSFVSLQTLIVRSCVIETQLNCWNLSSSSNFSCWKFVKPYTSSNYPRKIWKP